MKTITVAMPKGGVGKTTLTANLAVRAARVYSDVALLDLDSGQGSLTALWKLRGEPDNPRLFPDHSNVVDDLPTLEKLGYPLTLIDCPPAHLDLIEIAILGSDAVLIPIKPGILDIAAVKAVLEMCRERRIPHALVLSDVDARFKIQNREALEILSEEAPVLKTHVSHLAAYTAAFNEGKVGAEIDKRAKDEMDKLWLEVVALAKLPKPKRGRQ